MENPSASPIPRRLRSQVYDDSAKNHPGDLSEDYSDHVISGPSLNNDTGPIQTLSGGKPRLRNCFDYVKADRQRHFPSTDILFRQGIDALYSIQR